ncbi:hypothetical protein [Breoghania sp.]|uniref:hypothetical protein n=1 Tax=Breoghania sp. TaxID=2065378 RepID=UPI0026242C87|nr:hypothetical protein [Breoghania sp.]MDJ0933220.1 hypothetical protein [Breoghania sp.]
MIDPLAQRISPWSSSQLSLGRKALDVLMPHFEPMLLDTYRRALGVDWDKLPDDVVQNEKFKLGRIAVGNFDQDYFERQRAVIKNVAGIANYFDCVLAYHVYASNLIGTLMERGKFKDSAERSQAIEAILKSVFTDMAVVVTFYVLRGSHRTGDLGRARTAGGAVPEPGAAGVFADA